MTDSTESRGQDVARDEQKSDATAAARSVGSLGVPSGVLPPRPRQVNFARAGVLLTGVEFLNVLVGFGSTVYFAWTLGATALGVFFLFDAILNTVTTVTDFGLRGAVEKRISEGRDAGEFLSAVVLLKAVGLAGFALLAVPLRGPIDGYVGAPLTTPLVAGVFVYEFGVLTLHVLRGELRVDETAVLSFLRLAVYVVVAVALVQTGFGVRALVYGFVASYAVLLVLGALRVSTRFARPGRRHVTSLVDYAKYNGVSALGGYVYNSMDVLVVGYFLAPAFVGAYELAWRVASMTTLVSTVVSNTVFAQLSAWHTAGELDRVRGTIEEAITISLVVVVPTFFGVLLFSRELLGVVFGPAYTIAALAFVVLTAEKLVSAVNTVFDASVRAFDQPQAAALATAGSLTMNVVLNLLLVPRFGLVGAAAATAASVAVNAAILGGWLSRLTPLRVNAPELGWCVAAGGVMAGVLYAVSRVLPPDTPLALVAIVFLGGVVYVGVLLLSPSLREKVVANARAFA